MRVLEWAISRMQAGIDSPFQLYSVVQLSKSLCALKSTVGAVQCSCFILLFLCSVRSTIWQAPVGIFDTIYAHILVSLRSVVKTTAIPVSFCNITATPFITYYVAVSLIVQVQPAGTEFPKEKHVK